MDDLVKLMVERWQLPEAELRKFLSSDGTSAPGFEDVEQLRDLAASLLQDLILESLEEN